MQVQDLYSIIVTDKHVACRDFYVQWLGFRVVFEASWFVYLATAGAHPFGIAFMAPDHPSRPPGPERFNGNGMFVTVQGRRRDRGVRPAVAGRPVDRVSLAR